MSNFYRKQIERLLSSTDITIDGNNPWDLHVHNKKLYRKVLAEGSLGLGKTYMNGWWDCDQLDVLIDKILRGNLQNKVKKNRKIILYTLAAIITNRQSTKRAFEVGEKHYDIGNDLYKAMLDKRMVYTCGYWKNATTLDEAQEAKLDLVCRKLNLQPGQKILDIGCGWGSFVKYAAEHYGVTAVGITVSKEQIKLAKSICANLPIEIRLQDYREINEKFDHIVSLGMFEHVGYKNYKTFMQVACRCLKDNGLFLLHTIGGNKSTKNIDPWIDKYIFPNANLPSITQIGRSIENLFIMEDWHNLSTDYDKTLMAWHKNFTNNWNSIKDKYDDEFYRMWNYYLLSCAGTFRARYSQVWQLVLSKNGAKKSYQSIR
ncbi:MAG: cyclopropane fatty acyl phospholipid synthase [bacterium]